MVAAGRFCDAALMAVGLAATALPFARTQAEEAERWLRILRVSGAVGSAMQAIGVPEEPLAPSGGPRPEAPRPDALEAVVAAAQASRSARQADAVSTEDVLVGVRETYGDALEYALAIRGASVAEVFERLDRQKQAGTGLRVDLT
jgi:hypothetical protein